MKCKYCHFNRFVMDGPIHDNTKDSWCMKCHVDFYKWEKEIGEIECQ